MATRRARRLLALRMAASAAVLAVVATIAPALSSPAAADIRRITLLALTVRAADGTVRTAWLGCEPTRGTHPSAAAACAALVAVNGDFNALPPDPDRMCIMIFEPVTATATGRWRGRAVYFRRTYGNSCMVRVEAGAVFAI